MGVNAWKLIASAFLGAAVSTIAAHYTDHAKLDAQLQKQDSERDRP